MPPADAEWQQQERRFIDRFFKEKLPGVLGPEVASRWNEDACIEFAKTVLEINEISLVPNQGSNSFTLETPETIIQFRLKPLNVHVLDLASEIYGDLVPKVTLHEGFPMPVYSSKVIPGQVHMFQPFPKEFPLEREKTTVTEVAKFIAKAAAIFKQPRPSTGMPWTDTAPQTLRRLLRNSTLKIHAPELVEIIHDLQAQIHLLDTLPKVLTHHDFSQVNILVNDAGNVTGVMDFDEAGIGAFGMCIWGLYECFFGSMEGGKWAFYDERPILEKVFWDTLWANTPEGLKRENAEMAVKVALSIGVINRYFVDGMVDEIDLSKRVHRLSLEYARGILPSVWV